MTLAIILMAVGGIYGFVLGCHVGAKRGPAFCRGVVEGFLFPWRVVTRRDE